MKHRKLVQPENMNEQGALFGGYLLKWLDEFAYITACIEFPGNQFVTIGLDSVEFKHPIPLGEILCFDVQQARKGRTSVEYRVEVFGEKMNIEPDKALFATQITFVNVKDGAKAPIE